MATMWVGSELTDMDIKEHFPMIRSSSESALRNVDKKKKVFEDAVNSIRPSPYFTVAYDFRGRRTDTRGAARAYFQAALLIREGSKSIVKDLRENLRYDLYINKDGGLIRDPFQNLAEIKSRPRERRKKPESITVARVNAICRSVEADYRLEYLADSEKGKQGIFSHPKYGYSIPRNVATWLSRPTDPFLEYRRDERALLVLYFFLKDNSLDKFYAIAEQRIYRDRHNHRIVRILCRIHQQISEARLGNVYQFGSFACEKCQKPGYSGFGRIRVLTRNPNEDRGTTVVGLVRLKIDGKFVLKFGVTSSGVPSDDDAIWFRKRYSKPGVEFLEVIDSRRCHSELQAILIERHALTHSLDYMHTDIPEKFGGRTECRISTKASEAYCQKIFEDALEQKEYLALSTPGEHLEET